MVSPESSSSLKEWRARNHERSPRSVVVPSEVGEGWCVPDDAWEVAKMSGPEERMKRGRVGGYGSSDLGVGDTGVAALAVGEEERLVGSSG